MSLAERYKAIERRIKSNTKGLGYWSAIDAKRILVIKGSLEFNDKNKKSKE
jgi:hypothetical protein